MTLREWSDRYAQATDDFLQACARIRDQDLDVAAADGWTARQVIHHMADSETQSYIRLRRLLAEPEGAAIQGYDEAAWAECVPLGYRDLPIAHSIAVIGSVRASSLDVLRRLQESDLERFGIHTESGRYSVADWVQIYCAHPVDHREQMLRAMQVTDAGQI